MCCYQYTVYVKIVYDLTGEYCCNDLWKNHPSLAPFKTSKFV